MAAVALLIYLAFLLPLRADAGGPGTWQLLVQNAGISAMHAVVSPHNTVVLLDRTNIGPSKIALPPGVCRDNPEDRRTTHDCTAHSVLLDLASNHVRPLFIQTDTWCSSGQLVGDGTLVQTGGDADGGTKIRYLQPCAAPACDWKESDEEQLQAPRWYATNVLLPDGRQMVVGGRGVFSWEFIPAQQGQPPVDLQLLRSTKDAQADNLYPFVHLLPAGTLFIFANSDSIEYNYLTQAVVRRFPRLPGGPRNYPSAGSSVLLPIRAVSSAALTQAQVLVCGGSRYGAYLQGDPSAPATSTCGRITATDSNPAWEMEVMPVRRAMGDMLLLSTGDVLLINGAQAGCQGWGNAQQPALHPVVYSPGKDAGKRFSVAAPSSIPRMYHSVALLLPDARVLVAGSNTHETYTFSGAFPTELRVEAFSPAYLAAGESSRPEIVHVSPALRYAAHFNVSIAGLSSSDVELRLSSAPFATHSFSMGQRMVWLQVASAVQAKSHLWTLTAMAPLSAAIAPPSYYMLFVTQLGVPSKAAWVRLG